MSERCVFCGWKRASSASHIRFFSIPKDPGLKRLRWLHVIDKKDLRKSDKVCSLHFHFGRPSNDPSHMDFVPHLCINPNQVDNKVLEYLEGEVPVDSHNAPQPQQAGTTSNEQREREPQPEILEEMTEQEQEAARKPNILRKRKTMSSNFSYSPIPYVIKPSHIPTTQKLPQRIVKKNEAVTYTEVTPARVSVTFRTAGPTQSGSGPNSTKI